MENKVKIVYKESDSSPTKVLFGFIISDDNFFYDIRADGTGTMFKIGKNCIASIKEVEA